MSRLGDVTSDDGMLHQAILSSLQVSLYVWQLDDPDDPLGMRLVYANPASADATGLPVESVLGGQLRDAFPATAPDGVAALVDAALGGPELPLGDSVYRDDRVGERTFQTRMFSLPERRVCVAFNDVTNLRAAEARALDTLESMTDACMTLDGDGRVTFINAQGERFARRTRAELLGASLWEAFPDLIGTPMHDDLQRASKERVAVEFDMYYPPYDSYFAGKIYPTNEGLAVYFQDVTRRKKLEDRVLQAQKLEAIGKLVTGVAHDFNNLLNVIDGYAAVVQSEVDSVSESGKAALEQIRRASATAASLTARMLAFGRPTTSASLLAEVNAVVLSALALVEPLVGAQVDVHPTLGPDAGSAFMDVALVEQAIVNLVVNARDAMPGGGRIHVETRSARPGAALGLEPVSYVAISVRDEGSGMDEETRRRVFDPFFTTKPVGKGTGLGLSTAYGTIDRAGGYLDVTSAVGEGSTFTIYLPRVDTPAPPAPPVPGPPLPQNGTERVLVVEDNEPLRALIVRDLSRKGYDVAEAGTAEQALAHIATARFHLLVTDNLFPGGTGMAIAREALERRPRTPVVFVSGNLVSPDDILIDGTRTAFLPKPFDLDELSQQVRELLDQSASAGVDGS